jgi:hypothetical protein
MRNIAQIQDDIRQYGEMAATTRNASELQQCAATLGKLKAELQHAKAADAARHATNDFAPREYQEQVSNLGGPQGMLKGNGLVSQTGNNLISNAKQGAMVGLGAVGAEQVANIFDGVIIKMTGDLPEFMKHPLFEVAKPFIYSIALDMFLKTEAAAAIPVNTRGYLQRAVNLMQQGHAAEVTKTFVAPFAQELIGQLKDLPLPAAGEGELIGEVG